MYRLWAAFILLEIKWIIEGFVSLFLERQSQINQLNQSLQRVAKEGGRAAFIFGEAGIGKSTLIEHFLEQLPATRHRAIGFCDPYQTPRVLGPVQDIAFTLLGYDQSAHNEEYFFNDLVQHLFKRKATLVLVIEDLHWADQRTLDWLLYLGRRLSQLPVLLIGTCREEEPEGLQALQQTLMNLPPGRIERLHLKPLSLNAIEQISQTLEIPAKKLYDVTAGNPLFVSEMLQNENQQEILPASLSEMLHARINALSHDLQNLLEMVSCNPRGIPLELLSGLKLDPIERLSQQACDRRILEMTEHHLKFRHELLRMATYERMNTLGQRKTHARLLQHLLDTEVSSLQPELIVHHASGAQDVMNILKYSPLAARRATRLGAHREAAVYLKVALQFVDQLQNPEQQAELLEQWAYATTLLLKIDDEVIQTRQKAIQIWHQLGRLDKVCESLSRLSRIYWYLGEPQKAQSYSDDAIKMLDKLPQDAYFARARVLSYRAQLLMQQENLEQAIYWGEQAFENAVLADDLEMIVHSLNTVGTSKLLRGNRDGETQLLKSLEISMQQGFHVQAARVYVNLPECLIELGELQRAEKFLDEGIAFETRHDLDSWLFNLLAGKAQLRFEQDRYDEAIQIGQNVIQNDKLSRQMKTPAMVVVARSKIRRGDADAGEYLQRAVEAAQQIGEPQYLNTLNIARLEQLVLEDNVAAARQMIDELSHLDAQSISPRKAGEWLMWARMAGYTLNPFDEDYLPGAFAAFCRGQYRAAAEQFRQDNARYLAAWSLVADGSPESIREALTMLESIDARGAIQSSRLKVLVGTTRKTAASHYRVAKSHPYALTRQEQRILSLLAEGFNNSTIAEELSRSRRTIENHVSSILSKLQCKNRLEAVLRVQSEPWIIPSALLPSQTEPVSDQAIASQK